MPAILGLRKKPKLMKPKMRFNKISIKVRLHRGYYKLLRTILFIGLIFILLYPVIYIFTTSIKSEADMFDPTTIWVPKEPTIQTYKDAYNAMGYWEGFRNSLVIAGLPMLLQVISCSFIGYGFARLKFKESKLIFSLVLLTLIIPQQVIVIPQIMMYKEFDIFGLLKLLGIKRMNFTDTYFPFIFPAIFGSGLRSGLFIYLFRQFYRGMPKELEDAAYVDGCTPVGAYLKIMFPNAVPVIVSVALFSFVWHWNDTFGPTMFLTNMKKYPLSLKMVNIVGMITQSSQISDLTYIIPTKYAGIALAIFPLIILYALGQKFFVENLDRSGIVG